MSLIHLSTELRQELKLTPQLLQSMELLQMNSQELLDYLNQVSEENPLVEQTDLSSLHKAYEALRQKVHWINGGLPEDGHGAMPDRGAADRETESLSAFLCYQLERRRLPKPLLALTRYLAELVDEEGRLSQEDLDGVADLKIPQALTQQALETLQSLDPAGVGARSLSECLLLQLARQDAPSPLDMEIVRRFLPDLGKKHYSLISLSPVSYKVTQLCSLTDAHRKHPDRIRVKRACVTNFFSFKYSPKLCNYIMRCKSLLLIYI